jgi:hypothetical protein
VDLDLNLIDMLSYRRPAGSVTEAAFIVDYIRPTGATYDAYGNYHLRVGDAPPHILWSSHTDTVHHVGGYQKVKVSENNRMAYVDDDDSNCLGADCTTGVWLMLNLIKNGVPGYYIFHRDEETGMQGSRWIAENLPLPRSLRAAIAFDRKGTSDIVTHQMQERTCSDQFAHALGACLGMPELVPDSTGIYTDTLQYAGLISDCTNLSVGYYRAHTEHELQDLTFAHYLRDQLLKADFAPLLQLPQSLREGRRLPRGRGLPYPSPQM